MERHMQTTHLSRRLVMAAVLQITTGAAAYPVNANNEGTAGLTGPVEPNFARYYEPWESEVEPNATSYELPLDLPSVQWKPPTAQEVP